MDINIRKSIVNNFLDADTDEIKTSIASSLEIDEEITLPGLGVFFEILWQNSDENSKDYILNTLKKGIENYTLE